MKILEEVIPGSRCKGPEAGMSLLHLRKRKQANDSKESSETGRRSPLKILELKRGSETSIY